jgi:serine/threonine protein kinase
MDLYDGGEVWESVRRTGCIDPVEQIWYAAQMVEAVNALHQLGIVHRDLKCENFMIDSRDSKQVRLIDFGTCRDTQHPEVKRMGPSDHHVGTPNFMAPEAIDNRENDFRSDLWSLGCTFYQLFIGSPPFGGPGPYFTLDRVLRCDLWLPTNGLAAEARSLLNDLIKKDPNERLGSKGGIQRVLSHAFFAARPSGPPPPCAECEALRTIGVAIYVAAGPLDEAQGAIVID